MLSLALVLAPIAEAQSAKSPSLASKVAPAAKPLSPLDAYLKLRRMYGIRRAAGPEALEALVGKRILEIQGVVKGTFRIEDRTTVLLESGPDETLVIDAKDVPDWLGAGEVAARLIVQASRENEFAQLSCRLVGVAPDDAISAIEAREDSALAKASPKAAPKATVNGSTRGGTVASRSGSSRSGRQWYLPASQVLPHYVAFIRKVNPRLPPAQADKIARGIIGFSLKYGVDARLIVAMVMVESEFDPNATSHAGAGGLGQLMPGTARDLGVRDRYDTIDNLYGTVKLMRSNLDQYGRNHDAYKSLVLAVAAYNAGSGAVKRHGGVPPYRETQRYVQKVIALYRKLCGA